MPDLDPNDAPAPTPTPAAAASASKAEDHPLDALPDNPTKEQVMAAMLAAHGGDLDGDGSEGGPAAEAATGAPAASGDQPSGEGEGDGDGEPAAKDAAGAEYPAWVEEKYRSGHTVAEAIEAQAKGYAEARKALRSRAADLKVKPGEAKPAADAAAPEPWKQLDAATMRVIGEEFLKNGDLSKETYQKIQDTFKIPPAHARQLVEQGIERVGAENLQILQDAGYSDLAAFQSVTTWASSAVPAAELAEINEMLDGPHATKVTKAAAVRMLRDLHTKAHPAPKRRLTGSPGNNPAIKPITSQAEYNQELEKVYDQYGEVPAMLTQKVKELQARAAAGMVRS